MRRPDSGKTRYEILAEELEKYLETLPHSAKLPPMRTLMERFRSSQVTVDRSLQMLESRKLIERIAGRGYFRAARIPEQEKILKIDFCFFLKKNVVDNPLYSKISNVMLSEMCRSGCFMNIFAYEELGSIAEFRKRILLNKPDAFLMLACSKVSFTHVLQELKIPVIQIYPNVIEEDTLTYIIDNEKAIRLTLEHLISLGHRRIALLHGQGYEGAYMLDQEERIEAFYNIMQETALPSSGQLVKYGGFTPEEGYTAARELLSQSARLRPTAIFGNDYNAPGIYRAAQEMGLRIPEDLSVVGFDRLDIINFLRPALATIDIRNDAMVRSAAEKAREMAQKKIQEKGVMRTNVELITGGSTAPPPVLG